MHAFVSMLRASEARAELEAIQFAARDGAVSQMCHAWNVATTIALNSLGPRPIPPACRRDLADFNVDAEMRVITLAIDARLWTLAMDIMRWVDSRVRRIVGSIGRSSFSASELEQLDFKMVVLSETAGIFAEQVDIMRDMCS